MSGSDIPPAWRLPRHATPPSPPNPRPSARVPFCPAAPVCSGAAACRPRTAAPACLPAPRCPAWRRTGMPAGASTPARPCTGRRMALGMRPTCNRPRTCRRRCISRPSSRLPTPHRTTGWATGATRPTPRLAMRYRRSSNSTRTIWRSRAAPSTTRRRRTAWGLRAGGRSTPSSTARRCCSPR